MAYKIKHTAHAKRDISNILTYLTDTLFSLTAARHFDKELTACYRHISEYPLIYPVCRDEALAAKGFRLAPVMRYIAFYTVDEDKKIVLIHRIIHSSMDYPQQVME